MEITAVENLLNTYKTIDSHLESLEKGENKIQIPVNINFFGHGNVKDKSSYPIINFKYKDEYVFEDKLLIYDPKIGFNKSKKNLLGELKRNGKIDHYIKYQERRNVPERIEWWNSEYLRKSNEHVDWSDNGYGIKLTNILTLAPTHQNLFSPADKNIQLNYDHKHTRQMYLYSLYLHPDKINENLHEKIKFGKLKKKSIEAEKIFNIRGSKIEWCRIKNQNLDSNQISKLPNTQEGYDGSCDKITLKHKDLNSNSQEKWSTPYVFYDYRKSNNGSWHEYYQYLLGEYSSQEGKSENLLGDKNKRIWAVNYSNIFKIIGRSNHLQITINEKFLPPNHQDFLTVSDLFSFNFFYREKDEHKKISFDMKRILEGSAKIFFTEGRSMFSDFSVSIGIKETKKNLGIEFLEGLGDKKYPVNIEELVKGNLIQDYIHVEMPDIKKQMASQYWKNEEMVKVFRFVSKGEGKKMGFSELDLKKLNVTTDFDDEDGILKIKFRDYLNNLDKKIIWGGMRKIPTNHKMIARAEEEESARNILKTKEEFRELPKYFWDSIQFSPVKNDDFDMHFREHKITYAGSNEKIREQWNKLIKSRIDLFNDLNFHADSLILTEEAAKKPVKSWFKSKSFDGNEKALSKELIFTETDRNERYVKVSVSVNNGRMSGKKDFDFQIVKAKKFKRQKISPAFYEDGGKTEKDEPLFGMSENVQKIMAGTGCVIAGGGITSLGTKALAFFKRKF